MREPIELFPRDQIVGVFRGFHEGGLEFHADLTLPYRSDFHNIPMHGQFLLVQLETPDEAVLGRITSLSSEGRLSGGSGEEFNLRAMKEHRPIPESLRLDYLKYRVNIRMLGVLRQHSRQGMTFVASHRRLPHVGSPVAFASPEVLREIAGHNVQGAEIGFLSLGEYVYAAGDPRLVAEPWMQIKDPCVVVKFPIESLVSRRTFVFARAGFGKSNLNKLLFSMLYSGQPTAEKRGGRRVPVGTLLFDPDGEYFWPDDKGRPGLCDVPELREQIVVFTPRKGPGPFYQSFVAGDVKLDIRRLKPADVVSIALPPEKQEQQNVRKLKGLDAGRWTELVDLIHRHGNDADETVIQRLLSLNSFGQELEMLAARANVTTIVRMLHDPGSQLMDMLMEALGAGKLCVVDLSQLRGGPSLVLSGLILRRIFDRNQEEFTKAEPKTIPTIAVVEEAQSVLNADASRADPYVEWVKEGRKYDLGAVLITQQPGSIPQEILSQGDNWFVFHLLSAGDLRNVRKANAHFSEDLLAALLNEPIPGQGVFWSSVGGKPYPLPIRVLSFETLHRRAEDSYQRPAVRTFASELRARFQQQVAEARSSATASTAAAKDKMDGRSRLGVAAPGDVPLLATEAPEDGLSSGEGTGGVDVLHLFTERAIQAVLDNPEFQRSIDTPRGIPWGAVLGILKNALPPSMPDREDVANRLVPQAVSKAVGGSKEVAWTTERRDTSTRAGMLFIKRIPGER